MVKLPQFNIKDVMRFFRKRQPEQPPEAHIVYDSFGGEVDTPEDDPNLLML